MNVRVLFNQVLDFPLSYNNFQEANSKLRHTYMWVNNRLVYIEKIGDDQILYKHPETEQIAVADDIRDLRVFLPKGGIYRYEDSYYLLGKRPCKQWKKSFTFDLYHVQCLSGHYPVEPICFTGEPIDPINIFGGIVWYATLQIGDVQPGKTIHLSGIDFIREVTARFPDYTIEVIK